MTKLKRLNREFFTRRTETVAKDLLGNYLVRETENGRIVGKIIEVEAYLGVNDKASHSYDNKKTKRTLVMYSNPGTFYVYLIYGMYYCLNVITEDKGIPCAVLIRQLYPIEGINLMIKNRKTKVDKNYKNLVDGPGKLCIALCITKEEFNGQDSCSNISKLYFSQGDKVNHDSIIKSRRVGVDYAEEDKDLLLRYTIINKKE